MTEWRDCTSYRQGERLAGAEPRAWTASLGRTRMTVVKNHIYNPDRWTLHCAPWFDTHDMGIYDDRWYHQRHVPEFVEYIRADLVPAWSSDMDAAPRDGSRVLTFHPANPKAVVMRARHDSIVWNAVKAGQWWYSLPEQPPTHWMRIAPPKEGE